MKRTTSIVLCASLILGGCASMDKEQTKDIPKTVSVKDYDGKYIGEHKERNKIFLKKYKAEAEKKYKKYVKEVFNKDVKIIKVYSYTTSTGGKPFEGLTVMGTVDYDIPFNFNLNFEESKGHLGYSTITADQSNELKAAISALMFKRYENDIENARMKFKEEVEKQGYYAMNNKLMKQQEFRGVTRPYLNFSTNTSIGLNDFKKDFKPLLNVKDKSFYTRIDILSRKYPQLMDEMRTEFIAFYNKKAKDDVNKYSWNLQIPTNDTMKKIPGTKMMYFYKDGVSPSELGGDGKLKRQTKDISMIGGEWDRIKKEKN
ncbi:hypothetical protein HMPREF3282_05740 [Staphylococcus sp. HMSC73C01]|uniref:DUF1672 family protein n=1 Tax=unclassified Staphylococcus TaxID=91994 RepID=UPI0008A91C47|nr:MULTISPECIES: DUF1672 family protein [unclassified Staphylococcus]OHP91915.1 hypothetical protein HMPREF2538_08835 [Staphylococcus sp. HMSC063E12]OHS68170.1 hypothetical protein HMPREF3282_05740 [Staphylococcus sp. HMSC73C01]